MKKRIFSLVLCLCLLLTPALAAEEAPSLRSSGLASLPKLSKGEITRLLTENPLGFAGSAFFVMPSTTAPYTTGTVSDVALTAALNRLNLIRRLAGLEPVVLDSDLTRRAQYGAVLLAAGGTFTHYPDKPADMEDNFYKSGLNATSSSNIYMGTNATLPQAVDAFMDDSDGGNLPTLGHRRWLLNPTMGKTGFGFSPSNKAYSSLTYNFATLWAFDRSGSGGDYDFVSWPASGAFPNTLFEQDQAWSITLNPGKYTIPNRSDLRVTLTRASDGAVWTLDGGETYAAANSGAWLGVDTGNYGVANCIIFRPAADAAPYSGTYTVTIDGLRTADGQRADFTYEVDFFTPGAADLPTQPDQSAVQPSQTDPSFAPSASGFADVSADAWYASDVDYVSEVGLFNGVGGNRFDPNGSMTRVMLMTVLARLDGADTTPHGKETWYIKGHRWAVTNRISDGLDPDRALTFEELSTMLYKYAKFRYGATAVYNYHLVTMPDGETVSPWAKEGTNWMVDVGLLHGDENGFLNPQRTATRSQVAALLHRFTAKFVDGAV